MQKYKEMIECLTAKRSGEFGENSREKANVGHVSFVSAKSEREKVSLLDDRNEKLEDSVDDILQRVSKIREKYEKRVN